MGDTKCPCGEYVISATSNAEELLAEARAEYKTAEAVWLQRNAKLVAEVERLREEGAKWHRVADEAMDRSTQLLAERDRLRTALEPTDETIEAVARDIALVDSHVAPTNYARRYARAALQGWRRRAGLDVKACDCRAVEHPEAGHDGFCASKEGDRGYTGAASVAESVLRGESPSLDDDPLLLAIRRRAGLEDGK